MTKIHSRAARRVTAARALDRIFGTAPGVYGSGVEDLLGRGTDTDAIGAAYLAAASHTYGGADGEGDAAPGAFAQHVADADALVHPATTPAAISSKAPKMPPSSAVLPRRQKCLAAPPI